MWTTRKDTMPPGLLEAARPALEPIYDRLDLALSDNRFACCALSIADIALFPHMSGAAALVVPFSAVKHAHVQ